MVCPTARQDEGTRWERASCLVVAAAFQVETKFGCCSCCREVPDPTKALRLHCLESPPHAAAKLFAQPSSLCWFAPATCLPSFFAVAVNSIAPLQVGRRTQAETADSQGLDASELPKLGLLQKCFRQIRHPFHVLNRLSILRAHLLHLIFYRYHHQKKRAWLFPFSHCCFHCCFHCFATSCTPPTPQRAVVHP